MSFIVVCMCSRVQGTLMDIPNKQICTPVMFLYVLCAAVRMVSRSRVQRVNLYAIPQLLPILLPKAWSGFVDICTERF